jgi:hypothetical protein
MAVANGERPEPRVGEFEEGVLMLRYYSQVVMKMGDDGVPIPLDRPLTAES